MKSATALLSLVTAALATPLSPASPAPANGAPSARCASCPYRHHKYGLGRHDGVEKYCGNWVPVTEDFVAIDIEVEICLNVSVDLLGIIDISLGASLDVNIDIAVLRLNYPTCKHLVCDPTHACRRGEVIPRDKCWEHEFDQTKFNNYES